MSHAVLIDMFSTAMLAYGKWQQDALKVQDFQHESGVAEHLFKGSLFGKRIGKGEGANSDIQKLANEINQSYILLGCKLIW